MAPDDPPRTPASALRPPAWLTPRDREASADDPVLVAVFSESVGDAFIQLLDDLGGGALWLDHGSWKAAGSATPLA